MQSKCSLGSFHFQAHGHGIDVIGDNKNLKDQDGNILKLKEENNSLVKKIAGKRFL